jgi:hypothetical protein
MEKVEDSEDLDDISKELIAEFQELGIHCPLITKMFMDLISIVAKQNEQIEEIIETMESLARNSSRCEEAIKEHDWKLNILKDNLMESFNDSFEARDTSEEFMKKKKALLN